jgi:protein SCO1
MSIKYFILFLFIVLFSCKEKVRTLPYYNTSDFTPIFNLPKKTDFHTIKSFSLIDQQGKAFTEKNMADKICVVDFFFTTCPGICPKMTSNMFLLQEEFNSNNNILLLSHSVTPERDSVPVLAAYAADKKVNYNRWKLLTGNKKEIYDLGRKFYFVEEDLGEKRDSSIFLHTENFVLVDKNRRIRGIYNGLDKESIDVLIADIKVLEKE